MICLDGWSAMVEAGMKSASNLKWLWLVVLLALAAFGVWHYASRESGQHDLANAQPVKIGIATWPGFAPVYIATQRGFFGDLKVEPQVLDDFTARQAAFMSGKTDFTIYTIDSLAFDAAAGVRGKIVMVLDKSAGADGIVAKPGISSLAQLKGRKVAYTRGSPAHFLLYSALTKAGLRISDIVTVEVDDPTRAAEAFLAGSVDAAVTWEPYLGQIKGSGKGNILEDTRTLDDRIVDVLVASEDVVTKRPEVVQAVVSGWMRALDEVGLPKGDTFEIMATGLGMKSAEFEGGAKGVTFATRALNWSWLGPNSAGASRGQFLFEDASKVWIAAGFKNVPIDGSPFVTNRFVKNERR